MSVPEVIDVHVHYTRNRQQEKVVFNHPGWPDEWYNANPEGISEWFREEGLSHIFAINYIDINRIIDNRVARLAPGSAEEAEARKDLQVKIHPGLSRFYPGDEKMFPLYEKLSSVGVPILSDSGAAGGKAPAGSGPYGEPVNFYPVFEKFPNLRFIMAHLTTAYWDERIELARRFPQVQFDISGGFFQPNGNGRARDAHRCVPIEDAARFLKTIGTDRCMFGTDAPGSEVRGYVRTIMGLDLSDTEKEDILAKNARRFIDLK